MPTDATADQGGGEPGLLRSTTIVDRLCRQLEDRADPAVVGVVPARVMMEAKTILRVFHAAHVDRIAALPLHASCVELMEELVGEWADYTSPAGQSHQEFSIAACEVIERYLALKAAQELPNAD